MKHFVKKLVKKIKKGVNEYMNMVKEVELAKIDFTRDCGRAISRGIKTLITDKQVQTSLGIIAIGMGISLMVSAKIA
jgi:hypothetical protein